MQNTIRNERFNRNQRYVQDRVIPGFYYALHLVYVQLHLAASWDRILIAHTSTKSYHSVVTLILFHRRTSEKNLNI